MEFLMRIEVTWPPDGDPAERERLIDAEAARARELAAAGTISRLWRNVGVEVFPLAQHPSDPGAVA